MVNSEPARLHLDADTSRRRLQQILQERGHDVTRTPNKWMPLDASDEEQLLGATQQGRIIFTFNIGDFSKLAQIHTNHAGILLANQRDWPLSRLAHALDRLLTETAVSDWKGQVRWLNDWL
ncbi:MAG: DUF5615 family PIN-like protein [Chloroflexota bacterium]